MLGKGTVYDVELYKDLPYSDIEITDQKIDRAASTNCTFDRTQW